MTQIILKRRALLLSTSLLAGTLAFGTHAVAAGEPVKIGFAIAESGWMANYDSAPFRAAVLKIEEINKAGGLLGRQIEYEVRDTKTEREGSATAGQELVASGIDFLVVSGDYDFGAPAALAAASADIISFSSIAGDAKMGAQGVGPLAFTGIGAAQTEGIAMAQWAAGQNYKTAYLLTDTLIQYTKSVSAGFRLGWSEAAGAETLVGEDTFVNSDASIASQITRIKQLPVQPDFIFLSSVTPGGASAVRQLRAAGIQQPILSNTAMSDNYWLDAAPGLSGFYVPALMSLYGDDPRPELNAFVEAFKARWNEPPVTSYAIAGYSMIEQWARAVEKAGTTETRPVLDALNAFRDEPFTIGPTTFTPDVHIQLNRPFLIMETRDGSFRSVEVYRSAIVPTIEQLLTAN
ncbi:ABC transporter substrate-binding protein [Shinella daejeonensis]|uniref:ABC transporter substrate-binding protein n=1 Tax=Shinella daejeonensis TaxID=659017 RepID=UPI0020C81C03|nr:ABC transporter substrate-binding protein [Shinella daejeonensis]MCP8895271.1 ABC transporter substrate-binding protein [Shinella daejeonensis]